jgi:hypothetical protein
VIAATTFGFTLGAWYRVTVAAKTDMYPTLAPWGVGHADLARRAGTSRFAATVATYCTGF